MTQETVTVEYVVRKIIGSNQPGNIIAGPFKTEQEAKKESNQYADAAVFKETWLS